MGSFGTLRWYLRPERFCWTVSFNIIVKRRTSDTVHRMLLRHIAFSPKPKRQPDRVTARGCRNCGNTRISSNAMERGARWQEDFFFSLHLSRSQTDSSRIEKCGILLVLKGMASLRFYLTDVRVHQLSSFVFVAICTSVTQTNRIIFESNLHL